MWTPFLHRTGQVMTCSREVFQLATSCTHFLVSSSTYKMSKLPKLTDSSLKWALCDVAIVGIALGNFMAYNSYSIQFPYDPVMNEHKALKNRVARQPILLWPRYANS